MSLQSKYTILKKITEGGTAEIFLAKQHGAQGFEKVVVLKRIFPAFYADPQFRHMLVDEAHIAMSLNHSNIVQILDLGEVEGRYFLALELVDGWTMDNILRRAKAAGVPFPPPLALYLIAEVCRALAYAHGKARDGKPMGIVHRDVSPHNVLVSEQGEIKLTDFGIAKAQNKREETLGTVIKGKIAFMSPEQASGTEIDARSDLFSLGTMLYVMITRRYPFDAPTDFETLMQVRGGDFLPPETARPGLNPELYRVIRKAMGKEPADRYQKAEDMLVDVEQVMRLAFRAVGQTELVRWLADLAEKDGALPLSRQPPQPDQASSGVAGVWVGGDQRESGIVLDLQDAEEIPSRGRRKPPPPLPSGTAGQASPPGSHGSPSVEGFNLLRPPLLSRKTVLALGGGAVGLLLLVMAVGSLTGKPAPPTSAAPQPAPSVAPPPAVAALELPAPAPGSAATPPAPPKTTALATDAPSEAPASAEATPKVAQTTNDAAGSEPAADDESRASAPEPAHGKAVAKAQVSVAIKSDPEGSKVSTRQQVLGTTPVTIKLRRGVSYDLTFTKAGYAPASKRARISSATQSIQVTLKKIPEPKPEPKKVTPPAPPPKETKSGGKDGWWKPQFSR